MIKLVENFLYQNKYLFILQKKANFILPSNIAIRKVAHINLGLTLILFLKTSLKQLEKNADHLAQTFGVCCVRASKK